MHKLCVGRICAARRTRIATVAACTVLAGCLSAPVDGAAQPSRWPCGDRTAILDHFETAYGEVPTSVALDAQGRVLEVLVAPSGTWTMLVSIPGGLTCLIASGVAWEEVEPPVGAQASGARL